MNSPMTGESPRIADDRGGRREVMPVFAARNLQVSDSCVFQLLIRGKGRNVCFTMMKKRRAWEPSSRKKPRSRPWKPTKEQGLFSRESTVGEIRRGISDRKRGKTRGVDGGMGRG